MPKGQYKNPKERARKISEAKQLGDYFSCLVCKKYFWRKPSAIKKGNNKFCSRNCYFQWQKGKKKTQRKPYNKQGKNNPNWKGGLKSANSAVRNSKQFQDWRQKVFERDNWICQKCGKRSKANRWLIIHAHHIKPFAVFPKLRLVVDNGLTLCKKCHSKEPKGKEILKLYEPK